MNNEVHSGINGTRTEQNLTDAFNSESRSHMKYTLYSDAARRSGDPVLANMLRDMADNEKEHAEIWMEYLGELYGDKDNIQGMLAKEQYESDVMYPEYADTARSEGFMEIADKMRMASEAEKNHASMLESYLTSLENGTRYSDSEEAVWSCTNCGYSHIGKAPAERCPLCSHPKTYFKKGNTQY